MSTRCSGPCGKQAMQTEQNMKHIKLTTSCITLLLFFALMVPLANADTDGFRGMRWGTPLSEIQKTKQLVLTKENGNDGSSLYSLENEELRFGVASLTGIHCSFSQERLHGVILLFQGAKAFAAMRAEAFERFGESKRYDQNGEEMYNWAGNLTNTILSYNPDTQSGFLFMKQRKPVGQPDEEETKQVAGEKEPETPATFDKTREVKQENPPTNNISPEIQGLIDRDQALAHLCWGTVGPEAENACRQMREGVQKLIELGMCMTPQDPGPDVIWSRCQPAAKALPSENERKEAVCHRIGEMFESAAELRDDDTSPQAAEQELAWYRTGSAPEITTALIKETVDLVFFNPKFVSAWGMPLNHQIYESCRAGRGPYEHPLE